MSKEMSNKMKHVFIIIISFFFFLSVKSHSEAVGCDFKPFLKSTGTENYYV